jgi:hypothetical protein
MVIKPYIAAYWGPRPETMGSCAQRLKACLEGLQRLDSVLGDWYLQGETKAQALERRVLLDEKALSDLLWAGRA